LSLNSFDLAQKIIGRVIVSEQASTSKGIATRYATALFGLADEQEDISTLEQNVGTLKECLDKSVDLASLISSPMYSRDQQQTAITAIAKKLGLSIVMTNTLSLMAVKRRLFVVPTFLTVLSDLIAVSKNEIMAEVVSAKSLSKGQLDKLAKILKGNFSKDVKINATVDPGLIGGMIVKVGSTMIDTTIKAKLNSLQNVMKEVG
jgi:F-type H+-transporting ATPase subunit delta